MSERIRFYDEGKFIRAFAPDLGLSRTFSKYDQFGPKPLESIAIEMHAYFCKWGDKYDTDKDTYTSELQRAMKMTIDLNNSRNSVGIEPPINFSRSSSSSELEPVPSAVVYTLKEYDQYKRNRMDDDASIPYMNEQIYKQTYYNRDKDIGRPWDLPRSVAWDDVTKIAYKKGNLNDKCDGCNVVIGVPKRIRSLRDIVLSSINEFDKIFGGTKHGANTVPTTANIEKNLPVVVKKYDRDTVTSRKDMRFAQDLSAGMKDLDYAMRVDELYEKLQFDIRPPDITNMTVPQDTSSGIRDGERIAVLNASNNATYVTTPNGSKNIQEIRIKYYVQMLLHKAVRTMKIDHVLRACSIVLKHEINNIIVDDALERAKMYQKGRDFFIGHLSSVIFSRLTQGGRQRFERGWIIQVGIKMLFGGSYAFRQRMGDPDGEDMVYFDGDISGLDTGMQKIFLELYSTSASKYQDHDDPGFKFYLMILKLTTENLSVKMVNIFRRTWRIMIGCMPSGFYETSHGNSWVVALWFYMYVNHVMTTQPHRASEIRQLLKEYKIGMVVFGDDHVGFCPRRVHDVVNEKGFKAYLATFGMVVRDNRDNLNFFSTLRSGGEVNHDGIVFLKKQFIETYENWVQYAKDNDFIISPVLPYRTMSSALHKIIIGSNWKKTEAEYCMSAMGMVYENAGVNHDIHWLSCRLYANCLVASGYKDTAHMRDHIMKHTPIGQDLTRSMRKANISLDQLVGGLPSVHDLMLLHKYDPTRANFVPNFENYRPGLDIDEEDFSHFDNKVYADKGFFKDPKYKPTYGKFSWGEDQ